MRKSITINIPEPCHEDWNKMTPNEKGHHCDSCQKTVFDFTTKTDEQIIKTFVSEGRVCGRFKTQQLNREIVLNRKEKNDYLSWAASGLFAFLALGNQEINAQCKPITIQTDSLKGPQIKGKVATSRLNKKMIYGTVTTKIDGLPLPGATILIKGTAIGELTDFDGDFKLKAKLGDTLTFSYEGLVTKEISVNRDYNIKVALEIDDCYNYYIVAGQASYNSLNCYKQKRKAERKAKRKAKREAIKNGIQKRTTFGKLFYGIKSVFSKK